MCVRVILSLMCVILTSRGKLQPNDKENLKRYWTDRERTELLLFNVFILQGHLRHLITILCE